MEKQINLQNFIISIVIIGVILVMGIYIVDSIQTVTLTTGYPNSASNETLVGVTEKGVNFGTASLRAVSCGAPTYIANSSGYIIGAANYTQTNCNIRFSSATQDIKINNTNWKISYSYTSTNDTATSIAAGNVTTALSTGTSWISILVVVGFATIILTMLTSGLGRTAQEATPYY